MDILIIILSILKIIGLILLYALLFIVLLTIIILFIPIRYSIYGEKKENNDTIARVKVTYFFRFLSCYFNYEDKKPEFIVKLLGFTIVGKKKKIKDNKIKQRPRDTKTVKNKEELKEKEEEKEEETETETEEKKEGIIKTLVDKANFIISKIKLVVNYPNRKEIQKLTLHFIKDLLNVVKPKHFKLEGEIGFSSPDTTGYFMALTSTLPFTDLDIKLRGNFEKEIFVGKIETEGKFRIFSLLWLVIKYILNKPIRRLIKQFI